ncbi:DNA topoisomerase (ATP-hydrolyzing) subunit B [Candidatus Micrarchaeota archaeon]|nr:DNA topoisomerase (ATP-hydrolyzing) subunit B [Candidatus Micrarchaeota archaeon]MBD3417843.1 DNA topoisomerase (ATP-hydrolyzing) subunit B [Candidatus Micrarchaeota archaeon]
MVEEYGAESIKVLEGLEGVRRRPAMYIGDTSKRGLHHLIFEVVDNSIDEALAGYCKNIEVLLKKDGSVMVRDDGRGIPVETHSKTGKSALELVTTMLHAGGKFEKKAYQVSGGLHGVGLSVVNALSEWMEAEVHRNGKIHLQKYKMGRATGPVEIIGNTETTCTIIRFKPDMGIFTGELEFNYLKERLRELAFLNAGLRIVLRGEESGQEEAFQYEGGISTFVEYMNKSRKPIQKPFSYGKKVEDVDVEYAIQYTENFTSVVHSFVNNINTIEGGTHLVGFRMALTRAINEYMKGNKALKGRKISGDDVLEGLTAIVSVKVMEPQFEGQTKTKLGNAEVKGITSSVVYDSLMQFLNENPAEARMIGEKVLGAMNAREAAQKAKELIRRKSVFESSVLPGKLADCIERDPQKAELFIVEGDSAGGSAKQGRDRQIQAILPLKGKILNVEKAQIHKILKNEEIKTLIMSLGTGFGDDFDPGKLRYHKIVIMTDADVDGSHIRTLLLTLFYRYFKELVERGHLYIAQPPLYRVKKGKAFEYAYDDEEMGELVAKMGENAHVSRYKGLGEMNPGQLWETTLNPENRKMKKVTIQDAMLADELFTTLMGDAVEPRRKFIDEHAKEVENLDV